MKIMDKRNQSSHTAKRKPKTFNPYRFGINCLLSFCMASITSLILWLLGTAELLSIPNQVEMIWLIFALAFVILLFSFQCIDLQQIEEIDNETE